MITEKRKRGRPASIVKTTETELLTIQELSEMLKMSVSHLYTLTSTKQIPHIKMLSKKILFDKNEIHNWLRSKSVPTI